jgi:hypothetical protein
MNLGFTRYSPQLQDLLRLHTEAAEVRTNA